MTSRQFLAVGCRSDWQFSNHVLRLTGFDGFRFDGSRFDGCPTTAPAPLPPRRKLEWMSWPTADALVDDGRPYFGTPSPPRPTHSNCCPQPQTAPDGPRRPQTPQSRPMKTDRSAERPSTANNSWPRRLSRRHLAGRCRGGRGFINQHHVLGCRARNAANEGA
jgi:hypothetical protein